MSFVFKSQQKAPGSKAYLQWSEMIYWGIDAWGYCSLKAVTRLHFCTLPHWVIFAWVYHRLRLVVGLARPSQPPGIVSFQCPITLQHLIFDSSAEIRILDVTVEPSLGKGRVFTEYWERMKITQAACTGDAPSPPQAQWWTRPGRDEHSANPRPLYNLPRWHGLQVNGTVGGPQPPLR